MTRLSASAGVAALCVPLCLSAQIVVGATAHVSAPIPNAAHTEATIVAHPTDANRLASCTMVVDPQRNRTTVALYLSEDRGAKWRLAVHDTVSRLGESWDPACGFAPDSVVMFATLPSQGDPFGPPLESVTRFYRSADHGRTWAPPIHARFIDNEDIAVDWTTGPYRGRIYSVGVRTRSTVPGRRFISLLYSTDGGKSFTGPVDRLPDPGTRQGTVGAPVVSSDGTLLVPVFMQQERPSQVPATTPADFDQTVAVIRVTNGGTTIDAPTNVAPYKSCASDGGPPVIAIDRTTGPFANRIYMVFADATQGRCQVKLSWSDDGKSWSAPIGVDDPAVPLEPATGPDAFFPQVAVNANGIVGISWYDRREDSRNRDFRQRFTASADGGASVLRSVAVSRFPFHYATGTEREDLVASAVHFTDTTGATWIGAATGGANRTYYEVGDYGGLAVRADGVFQPIWVDNHQGLPQLYTAPIRVSITAMKPADRDRALGSEVSKMVFVTATRTLFDAATCTVELGLDLTNTSDRALRLPLTVRVETALSQLGAPAPLDSRLDDLGRPVWPLGSPGQLRMKETVTHSARFKLEDCKPLAGRGRATYRYPLDSRLQGTPPSGLAGPKVLAVQLRVFEKP